MVYVSSVEALNEELPRETKVFAHSQCLLIYVFSWKVLSDAAVVCIAQFDFVIFMVKKIVYIYIIHISLDVL